jgi:hypothetical protein
MVILMLCRPSPIVIPSASGTAGCLKSLEPMGTLFIIYYLHYMLHMFTPTLYTFSQPLYHVCADFAQHIGIDTSTTACNSLPKVTKILDFNSIQLCLQESPKCKVIVIVVPTLQGLSSQSIDEETCHRANN